MDNLLYFQDEAGNEIGLIMIDRFSLEGVEYALLGTPEDAEESGIYVMKIEEKENEVSFSMPNDDEMEKVTPVVMQILEELNGGCTHDCCSCHGCHGDDCDCEEDDDCCDDDCDCCHHEEN